MVDDLRAHAHAVFTAFERRIDPDRPRLGYIETTNRCPFTCVMCPESSPAYRRAAATISLELFGRITRQLLYQDEVCLHLFGDPLMDPLIYRRIALMRAQGLRATFSTNALMLTPAATRAILQSGLSRLIVSCDAVTDATYRVVRPPGGRPAAARRRLDTFIVAWRAAGRPFELGLRFVELDVNLAECEAFIERWSGCGARIDLKSHLRFPDVPATLDRIARRPPPLRVFAQARGRPAPLKCVRHWFSNGGELAVQADGRVVPCCLAHSDEVVLGDLPTESLLDVWRGERFRRLRRALFYGERLDEFAICARCNHDRV